jgi:PAS domain-containing protein
MLDSTEAEWAHSGEALARALDDLRSTSGALRSSEERFRALVTATSDMLYRMSPDWARMQALDGKGFLPDTTVPDRDWMCRYIPEDEHVRMNAAIRFAVLTKSVFELEHRVLRGDGTTAGIGLSLVRQLVEMQGGSVQVASAGDAATSLAITRATVLSAHLER